MKKTPAGLFVFLLRWRHTLTAQHGAVNRPDEVLSRFGDPDAPGVKDSIPPRFKGEVIWVQFADPDEDDSEALPEVHHWFDRLWPRR